MPAVPMMSAKGGTWPLPASAMKMHHPPRKSAALQFLPAHLAVIVAVEQGETLVLMVFDLGERDGAVAVNVEIACRTFCPALDGALHHIGEQFVLAQRAVTVGIGRPRHLQALTAEFFLCDSAVAIGVQPIEHPYGATITPLGCCWCLSPLLR